MCKISYVNNFTILEFDDFLSEEEVNVILEPRKNNFNKAQTHYPAYYRNNDRLVENNESLSTYLFEKLSAYKAEENEVIEAFKSLNEKMRLCRYQEKQMFSIHQDGVYYPNETQESKYTFLLYLNGAEDFEKGETKFYTSKYSSSVKSITPQKGKLIIFSHQIWHEGAAVQNGVKYILRSDIIVDRNFEKQMHHDGYIWNLLDINKNQFLSSGRDTKIKLWNEKLELQSCIKVHSKSVLKMTALGNDSFISCSRDFTIKKWNLKGETLLSKSFDEMMLSMVKLNNDKLVVGGTTGNIYVLNESSFQVERELKVHNNWIWDVKALDDDTVISCSEDGTVKVVKLETEKLELIYSYDSPLFSLCVKSNQIVFVGAKCGNLIELDLKQERHNIVKIHNDIIRSIKAYKNLIITASEDNTVRSYDYKMRSIKTLIEADNFVQDVLILKENLYAAGFDGRITRRVL